MAEIKLRRAGYFVRVGNGWSGPWATKEAAKFAGNRDYRAAHKAEREHLAIAKATGAA